MTRSPGRTESCSSVFIAANIGSLRNAGSWKRSTKTTIERCCGGGGAACGMGGGPWAGATPAFWGRGLRKGGRPLRRDNARLLRWCRRVFGEVRDRLPDAVLKDLEIVASKPA